jgi:hypothetical protein
LIRITELGDRSNVRLYVEGTLSDGWVDALEECWLSARTQCNGHVVRIDLSGVTYVDDKGRDLLEQMMRTGAEVFSTGILTREIIGEIRNETGKPARRRRSGRKAAQADHQTK